MELLTNNDAATHWVMQRQEHGQTIGFVPTMGALHEGHLTLVRKARTQATKVVVSIFVNPTQFGPNEDFDHYPRTLEADKALLEEVGCDALYLPSVEDIYPTGSQTRILVPELSKELCGAARPGHFDGVATVVTILLNIIRPHRAYFGLKDYQQFVLIQRLVQDLHLPVALVGVEISREADGLARSSRNRYLNNEQRAQAPALYRALQAGESTFQAGERDPKALEAVARQVLEEAGIQRVDVDYVAVRNPDDLTVPLRMGNRAAMLIAARVGPARLIDNALFSMTNDEKS